MKYLAVAIICAGFLAGCSSLAPAPNPEVLFAQDQSACEGYGFKRQTDGFAQCMQLREESRRADDREHKARVAASFRQLSANLAAQNNSVTCNTYGSATGFGNSVYGNSTTTCR